MMWFALIKRSGVWSMKETNDRIKNHRDADINLASANAQTKDVDAGGMLQMYAPLIEIEFEVTQHAAHQRELHENVTIRQIEQTAAKRVDDKLKDTLGKGWVHLSGVGSFDLWNEQHHLIYRKVMKLDAHPMSNQTHITWLSKPDKKESADMDDLYAQYGADKRSFTAGINEEHNAIHAFKEAMAALCSVGGEE